MASVALLGSLFVSKAATASAQVIRGRLLDVHSDAPIASGLVAVLDGESTFIVQTRTATAGAFTLLLPRAGQGVLFASRDGYYDMIGDTVDLLIGDTVDLEFRLQPMVLALDTPTAVVRSVPPVTHVWWSPASTTGASVDSATSSRMSSSIASLPAHA